MSLRVNDFSTGIVTPTVYDSSEPSPGGRIVWDVLTSPREDNGVEEKGGKKRFDP